MLRLKTGIATRPGTRLDSSQIQIKAQVMNEVMATLKDIGTSHILVPPVKHQSPPANHTRVLNACNQTAFLPVPPLRAFFVACAMTKESTIGVTAPIMITIPKPFRAVDRTSGLLWLCQ